MGLRRGICSSLQGIRTNLGLRDDFMTPYTPTRPLWAGSGSKRSKRASEESVEPLAPPNLAVLGDTDMEDEENYFSPENRGGGND